VTLRRLIVHRLGTNAVRLVALPLLLAALAATLAACGGDNDDDAGAGATMAPDSTAAPADQRWTKVVPGGDCECADGSEFAFWERRADPTKVVFFLDTSGACFDAETCAFTALGNPGEENYDWKVTDDPAEESGIFDFARADNPFLDFSFIYSANSSAKRTRASAPRVHMNIQGRETMETALDRRTAIVTGSILSNANSE
jgi:hypothetical protein